MTRTRFLVAIAVAALLIEFLPNQATTIKWALVALAAVYLLTLALRTYPKKIRESRRLAAQEAADEGDYRRYKLELDSIRAKYDEGRQPDEMSPEYEGEIAALHDKYQEMLGRKFGIR